MAEDRSDDGEYQMETLNREDWPDAPCLWRLVVTPNEVLGSPLDAHKGLMSE